MSTHQLNRETLEECLASIDEGFRDKLIESYLEVKSRYIKSRYENSYDAAGLSTGKFCESVIRLLQHEILGEHTPFGTHIPNFADECRKLVSAPKASGNESLRIIVPRALVFLYTVRGKRGVGHVGGDIQANIIDLTATVKVCDWVVCELIRIYHKLPIEDAQNIVDSIALKAVPAIWEVRGKRRVLNNDLNFKQKTLLLLYADVDQGVLTEDLFEWVEYSKMNLFKTNVLKQLHEARLAEYDKEEEIVVISPLGINEVEENILPTLEQP